MPKCTCPGCGVVANATDAMIGRSVRCPKCSTTFVLENPAGFTLEDITEVVAQASVKPSTPEIVEFPKPDASDAKPSQYVINFNFNQDTTLQHKQLEAGQEALKGCGLGCLAMMAFFVVMSILGAITKN